MTSGQSENGTPASPPLKRRRGRKLGSIANVRSALAFVWRKVEAGEVDLAKAKTLVYIGSTLVTSLEKGELEERLAEVERVVASGGVVRPLARQASGPKDAA